MYRSLDPTPGGSCPANGRLTVAQAVEHAHATFSRPKDFQEVLADDNLHDIAAAALLANKRRIKNGKTPTTFESKDNVERYYRRSRKRREVDGRRRRKLDKRFAQPWPTVDDGDEDTAGALAPLPGPNPSPLMSAMRTEIAELLAELEREYPDLVAFWREYSSYERSGFAKPTIEAVEGATGIKYQTVYHHRVKVLRDPKYAPLREYLTSREYETCAV